MSQRQNQRHQHARAIVMRTPAAVTSRHRQWQLLHQAVAQATSHRTRRKRRHTKPQALAKTRHWRLHREKTPATVPPVAPRLWPIRELPLPRLWLTRRPHNPQTSMFSHHTCPLRPVIAVMMAMAMVAVAVAVAAHTASQRLHWRCRPSHTREHSLSAPQQRRIPCMKTASRPIFLQIAIAATWRVLAVLMLVTATHHTASSHTLIRLAKAMLVAPGRSMLVTASPPNPTPSH